MKPLYYKIAFLLVVLAVAIYYSPNIRADIVNSDLNNQVVFEAKNLLFVDESVVCDGRDFRSFGKMINGDSCSSKFDCLSNWPVGASYQIRDGKGDCCVPLGVCGYYT